MSPYPLSAGHTHVFIVTLDSGPFNAPVFNLGVLITPLKPVLEGRFLVSAGFNNIILVTLLMGSPSHVLLSKFL